MTTPPTVRTLIRPPRPWTVPGIVRYVASWIALPFWILATIVLTIYWILRALLAGGPDED